MMTQQQRAGWQLDESSAEAYERYLVPLFFAPGAEHLLDLVAPEAGDCLLDVACGTGIVARRAATRVGAEGAVVGLDINGGMLAVARAVSSGLEPPIEWHSGDAAAMPFPDGAFDAACCQMALQFFSDSAGALAEMHRVLTPDGRLALSVGRPIEHNPGYAALSDALERRIGAEVGAAMRSPFAGWDRASLRHRLSEAGFRDVRISIGIAPVRFASPEEFLRQEAASSPLAGPVGALSEDARGALIADLGEALRAHTDDYGVVFPLEVYLAFARR